MTITLDITPQVGAELTRQATLEGRRLETYAAGILEEASRNRASADQCPATGEHPKDKGRKSLVEVCAMVAGLTDDLDFSRSPWTERPVDF